MSASFFDLLKYRATGIPAPDMTAYDKARALAIGGGSTEQTMTGIPPLSFPSDGSPITIWNMKGNGQQTGTPSPQSIIMPTFCGVRTGNLFDKTTATIDYRVTASGTTYSENFACTDYINIEGLSSIAVSSKPNATNIYFYSSKTENADSYVNNLSAPIPAGAKYVRVNFLKTDLDTFMLNTGSTAKPYDPFGYAIPLTCAGQTVPVYLGQVSTVRKIRKLVLTGEEGDWRTSGSGAAQVFNHTIGLYADLQPYAICNMFCQVNNAVGYGNSFDIVRSSGNGVIRFNNSGIATTVTDWKSYLADQYANGTPVVIWYVLATPETAITNEPLCKIGDYADELHSTDAAVTIPTVKGSNTLTVDTPIQPSEMTITFKG